MNRPRVAFHLGRLRASVRIGWDLARSLVAPPRPDAASGLDPAEHLVVLAGRAREPATSSDLRVVVWNIHRNYDPEGVEETLGWFRREVDPDLWLLQEVPVSGDGWFWQREGVRDLFAGLDLAWAPMHRVSRPSAYYPFRFSGQLTASPCPVEGVVVVPLPAASGPKLGRDHEVRRVAIVSRHQSSTVPLTVVNVHLENTARPSGRCLQLEGVLDVVAEEDGPVLMAGDLNTVWGPLESALTAAGRHGFVEVPLVGKRLVGGLDRVFVRGVEHASGRLLDLPGSDHRPLLVTVALGAPAAPHSGG